LLRPRAYSCKSFVANPAKAKDFGLSNIGNLKLELQTLNFKTQTSHFFVRRRFFFWSYDRRNPKLSNSRGMLLPPKNPESLLASASTFWLGD